GRTGCMKNFGPFRLDRSDQCLWREDERLALTPKAFAVLHYLVSHAGRLVSQDELLEALWPGIYVQPEVLKSHIRDIRSALGDRPKNPVYIETLPKRGYRFIAPVQGPLPSSAPLSTFVGRSLVLAKLAADLRSAAAGERRTVFITGDPGMGKTALVDAF